MSIVYSSMRVRSIVSYEVIPLRSRAVVEVRADDTPAILAVLNADKKRLELLSLEKKLTEEYENGSTDAGARLKEVK